MEGGEHMTDEAFEKYQSVWTAVHNLVDKMLSGEAGAEDIRDKLTDEFRFWKRSGHDISATTPQPEQESFSPEAIRATQAAWKMGYDAAKAEQPEKELVIDCPRCGHCCPQSKPLTDELLETLEEIAYGLESARVWGGMEFSYNPLHPYKYLPLRDKARAAIAKATGENT